MTGIEELEARLALDAASQFGEKIVILRHDVDNIYDIFGGGLSGLMKKVANYVILAAPVSLAKIAPGSLDHIEDLLDIEGKYGATASYFFRPVTIPDPGLREKLIASGHEIGYHSDNNRDFNEFLKGLKALEENTGVRIKGFTKHGYSPVRSGGPWSERLFIGYGIGAGLEYLAQGSGHPEWAVPRLAYSKLWLFGHKVTLKKSSIDAVQEYVKRNLLPMILIHPEDLSIRGEPEKLEAVLSFARGVSVKEVIKVLWRLVDEDVGYRDLVNYRST